MEEFDKEQAIADIAKKLNIQKDKILYIEHSDLFQINDCVISIIADNIVFQEYNLYFDRCTIPNLILEITIKSLEFKMCCFEGSFVIRNNFDGYISIQDSIFEKDFGIFWVKKEIYKINVCKNIFKDVSIFENKILNFNFEKNSIQNITICNNLFTKEAYFNANSFNYECIFFKNSFENLSFYEANFEKSFIFFQNIIKGNLNAVNTNLNFTFGDLQEKITQEYEDFNKDKKEEYQKSLDKFANDFRDSFRTFKSALIKDSNLLDASNFHKYELYCKEIELKNKKDKTLKDRIDKWQLSFYRKLCDHHTDLLKAFHNLLIVVMIFSMFSFVFDKFKQPSHIENDIKYNIVKVDSKENYIFKEHNKTTYNLLSLNIEQESDKFIKNDFVYMIVFLILVLLLLSFNIFTSIYIFGSILYLIFSFLDLLALYTHIAVIVFFVLFALKFILLDDRQRYKRGIVVAISYTVCIFTLLVKPSLLLPALGSFLDKDSNATYPLLLSLSVVYFMFVVLILFSLQKTARKNSIVPS